MKRKFYAIFHLFNPAGIELLRCSQTQFASNVQRYFTAVDLPAKEKK